MDLVSTAFVFYAAFFAVFLPLLLALEFVVLPRPSVRPPRRLSPEEAAARYLAAHPLKRSAADDRHGRLAA